MYIGIEEVFIGGMAFALGTVIWAYSRQVVTLAVLNSR